MQLILWLVIVASVSIASAALWTFRRPATLGGKVTVVTIWTASSAVAVLMAVLVFFA